MKRFLAIIFLSLPISNVAMSSDRFEISPIFSNEARSSFDDIGNPIYRMLNGHYESTAGYFKNFELSRWADEYSASALIKYGEYFFQTRYNILRSRDHQFTGTGTIRVIYSGGEICTYPTKISIKAYDTGLYIRTVVPSAIPNSISNNICVTFDNVTLTHPEPYVYQN